jgi:hypothetical protein
VPVALSGLLALNAAGTMAQTLASSTRRRRRDLAILKTLGFVRRQVRHAVAWQATTIVAIALLIGLPAGVAGRPVGVALSRHPARRAARADRPAHRDRHRHTRGTRRGEPHRSRPWAGSSTHTARRRPQDRIRKGDHGTASMFTGLVPPRRCARPRFAGLITLREMAH